jgi:hypothetical protein
VGLLCTGDPTPLPFHYVSCLSLLIHASIIFL